MKKITYLANGYKLQVTIKTANARKIVIGLIFEVEFQWAYEDPYWGHNISWETPNKDKYRWLWPMLASHCQKPESYEIHNIRAVSYCSRYSLEHKVRAVHQEWRQFHIKLAEELKKLTQL